MRAHKHQLLLTNVKRSALTCKNCPEILIHFLLISQSTLIIHKIIYNILFCYFKLKKIWASTCTSQHLSGTLLWRSDCRCYQHWMSACHLHFVFRQSSAWFHCTPPPGTHHQLCTQHQQAQLGQFSLPPTCIWENISIHNLHVIYLWNKKTPFYAMVLLLLQ